MRIKNLFLISILMFGLLSCIEDTIQLENISSEIEVERSISIPIVKASFVFEDLAGSDFETTIIGGDTVMLYVLEDVSIEDTVEFSSIGANMVFDYIYLHHTTRNMFPVGLRLNLFLYNDSTQSNVDTIEFSDVPGGEFLEAPVLKANGLVNEDSLRTLSGKLDLDRQTLENLFERSSHIIISAEIPQTDSIVKILDYYYLELGLGLSAKGRYVTDLDSLFNQSITVL